MKKTGVGVSSAISLRKQCIVARNKAHTALDYIFISVKNRRPEIILKLDLTMVRSHFRYAVQFWSPHYRKDIDLLELAQRRCLKGYKG